MTRSRCVLILKLVPDGGDGGTGGSTVDADEEWEYEQRSVWSDIASMARVLAFFALLIGAAVLTWLVIPSHGSRDGATCQDGTVSAATGSGACSWHGGVAHWNYGTTSRSGNPFLVSP